MALLSQFLMLLLFAVGASLGQCPPREDILPCSCTVNKDKSNNFNIRVLCWKVDDVDDVRRALQTVKGIQKVKVEFKDSRLGSVPSDLFKGLHVTELTFYDCVLKRIGDEGRSAVEGLEDSIEKLSVEFSFSEANSLRILNVSRLGALESLKVTANNVKELGNEWFAEGPANLKKFDISVNKISKMGDLAFTQLMNLQTLWIGSNKIATLKRSMFPSPAVHLYAISLSGNKISSLPVDLFSNMLELKHVFLSHNSLQSIPEATWSLVWSKLELLFLDGNPLNCDEDFEWTLKESRPKSFTGTCVSPDGRKGVDIEKIIDDKPEGE